MMVKRDMKHERELQNLPVDFVLEVYEEKLAGDGEDSYYYALGEDASVVAALDGCGGSGARRYEHVRNKTGAYLASRVVSGAIRDWFAAGEALRDPEAAAEALKARSRQYLDICKKASGGTSLIRGSLSKELPTTCALLVLRSRDEGGQEAISLWAGDSRCYALDAMGLHQLTTDDLGGLDAMENLTADGVLTNVISASKNFVLNVGCYEITGPCVLFAATDGCFGYLPTPMEFEYQLLSTLCTSRTPAEWEAKLAQALSGVAGDDATLCGVSVGFGSFSSLVETLRPRLSEVAERYIEPLASTDQAGRMALWNAYREEYLRFVAQGARTRG